MSKPQAQRDQFKQSARELETDDDPKHFRRHVTKLVTVEKAK